MNSILGTEESSGAEPTTILVKQSRCFSVCSLLALESQPILTVVARAECDVHNVIDEENADESSEIG
jgi:hypothetical protein